mmetsp:Transcript_20164/g.64954  ORF Transcript_20164/g.64954 Transcript_20164/m.64954 type:complete len:86 (+) Transcript_20164:558-815(+)
MAIAALPRAANADWVPPAAAAATGAAQAPVVAHVVHAVAVAVATTLPTVATAFFTSSAFFAHSLLGDLGDLGEGEHSRKPQGAIV